MNAFLTLTSIIIGCSTVQCDRGTVSDLSDDTFEMLIAGGSLPDNGQLARHVVSIRTLNIIEYAGDNHFCSGVIISSRTILTAAHCVAEYMALMSPRRIIVVFGTLYRLKSLSLQDRRRVDRIVVHPKYKRYVKNDLAVLRLVERIPRNVRHVKSVVKRKPFALEIGMRCTTMGWGQMFMHGPYANEIMFLDVVIANHSLCSEKIRDYHAEGNLCTKPEADGNICAGDMGGPLLCEDHLVGIIGGAQQCIRVDAIKFVNYTYFEGWVDRTVYQLTGAAAFHNLAIYLLISQVM